MEGVEIIERKDRKGVLRQKKIGRIAGSLVSGKMVTLSKTDSATIFEEIVKAVICVEGNRLK